MAGGAKGALGNALIKTGIGFGGEVPRPASTGAQYTPVTPNVYNPAFSSVQANQAPAAPITAPAQQVQQAGLQALMANMMAQYQNVPGALAMTQQRPQMPAPSFSAPALMYRPNIRAAQQNLSRVKPSVYKTDLDKARSRISELEAAEQARQQASYDSGYGSGG
jgi:hypothetical protein